MFSTVMLLGGLIVELKLKTAMFVLFGDENLTILAKLAYQALDYTIPLQKVLITTAFVFGLYFLMYSPKPRAIPALTSSNELAGRKSSKTGCNPPLAHRGLLSYLSLLKRFITFQRS